MKCPTMSTYTDTGTGREKNLERCHVPRNTPLASPLSHLAHHSITSLISHHSYCISLHHIACITSLSSCFAHITCITCYAVTLLTLLWVVILSLCSYCSLFSQNTYFQLGLSHHTHLEHCIFSCTFYSSLLGCLLIMLHWVPRVFIIT